MQVRGATLEDAEQIARLSGQLGYSATTAQTARRLEEISRRAEDAVLVCDEDGMLLGWIHLRVAYSLTAERRAEVGGLVVDEGHRGRGVGRMLLERAEPWARQLHCERVRLQCNVTREGAHAFYETLGYRTAKVQKTFVKAVE